MIDITRFLVLKELDPKLPENKKMFKDFDRKYANFEMDAGRISSKVKLEKILNVFVN